MQIETCPLWGAQYPATGVYIPETGTYQIEYSARAGGSYVIAQELLNSQALTLSDEACSSVWTEDAAGPKSLRLRAIDRQACEYPTDSRSLDIP